MKNIIVCVILLIGYIYGYSKEIITPDDYIAAGYESDTKKAFFVGEGDESYGYIFDGQNDDEVKFVEPLRHIDVQFDSFTWYKTEKIYIPEIITYNNQDYRVTAIETKTLDNLVLNGYSLSIPSTVKVIEPYSVCHTNVVELIIENGLHTIMHDSMTHLINLESIELPESLFEIQSGCFNESAFRTVKLNNGIQFIGDNCFNDNYYLEEIILPSSIKSLTNCFNNCKSLRKIVIPRWLSHLEDCFRNCTEIQEIELCYMKPFHYNDLIFKDVDRAKCKLIVPDGCRQKYMDMGWGEFKIIEKSESNNAESVISSISVDTPKSKLVNLNGLQIQDSDLRFHNRKEILIKIDENGSHKIFN